MRLNLGFLALAVFFGLAVLVQPLFGQGTAFTYNGRINAGGGPANGSYDLSFSLCNAATNGTTVGSLTNAATPVANGLFTATLDFGAVFTGSNWWLEIAVRTNGTSPFATLSPRQPVMPSPYAVYAASAGNANSVPAADIVGTLPLARLPAAVVTNNQSGVVLNGAFIGNGGGLTNVTSGLSGSQLDFYSSQQYAATYQVPPIMWSTWGRFGTTFNSNAFNTIVGVGQPSEINYFQWQQAFNANPSGFALVTDDGLFFRRVNGVLTIDPGLFPWSSSQFAATNHLYHQMVLVYREPNDPDRNGGTSAGFPDSEGTNIEFDAMNDALAGYDGAKLDCHGATNIQEYVSLTQRYINAFRYYASNRPSWFMIDANIGGAPSATSQRWNYNYLAQAFPGCVIRLNPETTGAPDTNTAYAYYLTNCFDWTLDLATTPNVWTVPDETYNASWYPYNQMSVFTCAIYGAPFIWYGMYNIDFQQNSYITNSYLNAIDRDSGRVKGQPMAGVGSPTTYMAYVKRLNDFPGCEAVLLLNRSTNSAETCGFSWTSAGFPAGQPVFVMDAYSGGATNYGTLTMGFTNTLGPEGSQMLLLVPNTSACYPTMAGTFGGSGAGLTNLNITVSELPADVPLLDVPNTFTGANLFAGTVTATNAANAFTGTFTGNGAGLTGLSAGSIRGGLTTNLAVPGPGGTTNILCITNGLIMSVK